MRISTVSTTPTALVVISWPITNQIAARITIVITRVRRVGLIFLNASTPASVVSVAP